MRQSRCFVQGGGRSIARRAACYFKWAWGSKESEGLTNTQFQRDTRSRRKLVFAVKLAVAALVRRAEQMRRHPTGCDEHGNAWVAWWPVFATFTFGENLTDIKEAHRRWRNLLERMKRRWPGLQGVGVWQRQKRGAWHVHCVLPQAVSIYILRPMALECGFGTFVDLKFIGRRNGFRVLTPERVAEYMVRYMGRDFGQDDKGARLVCYWGKGARKATVRFEFVGSMREIFLRGKPVWNELNPGSCSPWDYRENWDYICRLGFECADDTDRERWLNSPSVRLWWFGPDGDPVCPF